MKGRRGWYISFLKISLFLCILIASGTIALHYIEGKSWLDSLYWTVTVLSTVGFGDITPTTTAGKLVFIGLATGGITAFGYAVAKLGDLIVEARVDSVIKRLTYGEVWMYMRDHVVIIGWDHTVRQAYDELKAQSVKVIIITDNDSLYRRLSSEGLDVVLGDPTRESTLQRVNISQARAVIIALPDDTKALMSILALRRISKDVKLVVRAGNPELRELLMQAGADQVVDTNNIAGRLLANKVTEPVASAVLENLASAVEGIDLVELKLDESFKTSSIEELGLSSKYNVHIIAVSSDGKLVLNPLPSYNLKAGDVIVLLGRTEDLPEVIRKLSKS